MSRRQARLIPARAGREGRAAPFRLAVFLSLALAAVAGCAGYASRVAPLRADLEKGNLDAALRDADRARPPASRVLGLMEKGLVLHEAGRWEESNAVFEEAETRIEDLYTKSLTREAAAVITSDNLLEYHGERFERVFINYYRALNYIRLGRRDDALVECRKVNAKLQRYRDAEGNDEGYPNDAFLQYLTGILYEWGGETNDAWISYRAAEEDYARYEHDYGLRPPPSLAGDLLRTAESLGFTDELERLRAAHPEIPEGSWRPAARTGELVLITESGFIPHKIEQSLNFPILESDSWDDDAAFAPVLAERGRGWNAGDAKIRYWLRVAVPEYAADAYPPERLEARIDGRIEELAPAEDLGGIARAAFDAERPRILRRTIVRALAKYGLHRAVAGGGEEEGKKGEAPPATGVGGEKPKGEGGKRQGNSGEDHEGPGLRSVLGFLVNVFGAATESADTRSWLVLPDEISIARVRLAAGAHDVQLLAHDNSGRRRDAVSLDPVEIRAGDVAFVTRRTYR